MTILDESKDTISALGAVFGMMVPDIELRRSVAGLFAESIEAAHETNPKCWELSFVEAEPYIRLNVGRVFAITLRKDSLSVLLNREVLPSPMGIMSTWNLPQDDTSEFKSYSDGTWRQGPISEIIEHWELLREAHLSAITANAPKVSKSGWAGSHNPEVLNEIAIAAEVQLPQPSYYSDNDNVLPMDHLLTLIEMRFPNWQDFSDPRFEDEEINYKKKTIDKAAELLNENEFKRLIEDEQFDEIVDRLDQIGKDNNLLWRSVPLQGDLSLLYQPELDKPEFCQYMFDLLYSDKDSSERLGTFCSYLKEKGLPNKWTFPTYFLFIFHPDTELFVKPTYTNRFMKQLDKKFKLGSKPTSRIYAQILSAGLDLFTQLQSYQPRDMVDIQSFIWVCSSVDMKSAKGKTATKAERQEDTPSPAAAECPFSLKTFELLEQLDTTPTYEFYVENKDALRRHITDPFKELLNSVRSQLPPAILTHMETEKRIFASILKQFAKHGCWPFYWGAFYTKGGKRTEDAQLFASMNKNFIDFGFYIGEYGSEQRARFLRNCLEHRTAIIAHIRDTGVDRLAVFGSHEDDEMVGRGGEYGTPYDRHEVEKWMDDPTSKGIHIGVFVSKNEVLSQTAEELSQKIADAFQKLFPMVLLASHDNPMRAIAEYVGPREEDETNPDYSLYECVEETRFPEELLARWVRAIHRKGQAVLYGPPGTGKTFVAEHLARHLIGGGYGFSELVQFHPAYSYEDFMQGIRPKTRADGSLEYSVEPGRFLEFCARAQKVGEENICVLIIDEINRANLARVFGELMYLLEYRDQEVPLAGGGVLTIPKNVRLIGTMNTADRSIALVDHALRRRFAFLRLDPNYDVLRSYHLDKDTGFEIEALIAVLRRLNSEIDDPHYAVGITYFLREDIGDQVEDIWRMEIEPYLEEYFFDQRQKAEKYSWEDIKNTLSE